VSTRHRVHFRTLAFLLPVVLSAGSLRAQPAVTASDSVDRYIAAHMARQHVPGLSLAAGKP
jgi:hypothetical protein